MHPRFVRSVLLAITGVLLLAPMAVAQVPGPGDPSAAPEGPVATGVNLYLVLLGSAVPFVTYLLGRLWPRASEAVRGSILIGVSAAVGVLYTALTSGAGLDDKTLFAVVQAVVVALLAHHGFYKPTGLNATLTARR